MNFERNTFVARFLPSVSEYQPQYNDANGFFYILLFIYFTSHMNIHAAWKTKYEMDVMFVQHKGWHEDSPCSIEQTGTNIYIMLFWVAYSTTVHLKEQFKDKR